MIQEVIERVKKSDEFYHSEENQIIIQALEEVEQYRALGTVEELKEAREKQVAKKPRTDDEGWLCCLNCGETFSLTNGLHKRNKYCGNCGTKIDWSERGGLNGNR